MAGNQSPARAGPAPGNGSRSLRFDRYMAGMDVMMWTVGQDPKVRLGITSVLLLDRPVDPKVFRATVARAVAAGPRMRQIVTRSGMSTAPPRFVEDPNFDLEFHTPVIAAPGRGTLADVLQIAERIGSTSFDPLRPLWEFALITGVRGGGCAVVQKVHHVLTDGLGGLQFVIGPLLAVSREDSLGGEPAELPAAPPGLPSAVELFADAQVTEARNAIGVAGALARGAGSVLTDPIGSARAAATGVISLVRYLMPAGGPLSPVMTGRSRGLRFATVTVPVSELKAASHAAGGKLNDGLIAAVAGGLARYHEVHDRPVPELRMYMPVNLRAEGGTRRAGNEFSQALIVVPMDITDAAKRVGRIHVLSRDAQVDPALRLFTPIAGLAGRLPTPVVAPVFLKRLVDADFVLSDVPGPSSPLYMCGGRVTHFYVFGPVAAGAMNVTALSYDGKCELGLATDRAAVPDPDVMLDCLRAGLAEVSALATDGRKK